MHKSIISLTEKLTLLILLMDLTLNKSFKKLYSKRTYPLGRNITQLSQFHACMFTLKQICCECAQKWSFVFHHKHSLFQPLPLCIRFDFAPWTNLKEVTAKEDSGNINPFSCGINSQLFYFASAFPQQLQNASLSLSFLCSRLFPTGDNSISYNCTHPIW